MVARPSNKNRPITGNRHAGTGREDRPGMSKPDMGKPDMGKDEQILALLNRLGSRLIESEKERIILRNEIAVLSAKTEQAERIFLTLQDRQNKIESRQDAQNDKIEKAAALADRIEETIQQQNRLNRRLDQMQGERVQMLRKLERIEETVIETQEALHAKALVLLTDQDVAADSGKPRLSADSKIAPPAPRQDESAYSAPFWHQPVFLRTAAMTAVVLLAIGGGWGVYQLQQAGTPGFSDRVAVIQDNTDSNAQHLAAASQDRPPYIAEPAFTGRNDNGPVDTGQVDINQGDAGHEIPMPATATGPENSAPQAGALESATVHDTVQDSRHDPLAPQNIIHADDETLLNALADDPDRLAAALNNIEPGTITAPATDTMAAPSTPAGEATDQATNKATGTAQEQPVAVTPPERAANPAPAAPAAAPGKAAIDRTLVEQFLAGVRAQKQPLRQALQPDDNLPPAIKEFENKAFDGVAEAQHDLAAIYTAGHSNVQTDYARAAMLFTEAALQGIANARYNLGVLYHQGLGVNRDLERAINWYRAAALLDHPEAQYNLGIAHIEGIGTGYDPEAAAAYFEAAARSGIMEAAYNLGLIYENGLLGAARPDQALRWYKKAADQGSPEARAAMNQLAKSMGISQSDIDNYIFDDSAAPAAVTPQPVRKSAIEPAATLRPEDKIDVTEIARYIPPLEAHDLEGGQETERSNNVAMVAQVQEQLMRLGLYPGPADGLNGPQTEDAIRTYQRAHELPGDGRVSEALLVHLLANELNSSLSPAAGGEEQEYGSRAE